MNYSAWDASILKRPSKARTVRPSKAQKALGPKGPVRQQKEAKTGKVRQIKTGHAAFAASSFSSWLITRLHKYIRDLIIFQGGTGGSKGCTRSNKNDDQRLWKGPWQLLLIQSDVKCHCYNLQRIIIRYKNLSCDDHYNLMCIFKKF